MWNGKIIAGLLKNNKDLNSTSHAFNVMNLSNLNPETVTVNEAQKWYNEYRRYRHAGFVSGDAAMIANAEKIFDKAKAVIEARGQWGEDVLIWEGKAKIWVSHYQGELHLCARVNGKSKITWAMAGILNPIEGWLFTLSNREYDVLAQTVSDWVGQEYTPKATKREPGDWLTRIDPGLRGQAAWDAQRLWR